MSRMPSLCVVVAGVVIATLSSTTTAFSTPAFLGSTSTSASSSTSTTSLFISSWGTKGSPFTGGGADTMDRVNPEENVQAYLKEPSAVEARNNIDGSCLVSGLVNAADRTDQFLFDLLNNEDSAFEFSKIVAFVKDAKFSKKRLLSRSARYTGLLDKLDFCEGDGLPQASQLAGVKSWIAVVEDNHNAQLTQIAQIAQQAHHAAMGGPNALANVAILLVGANELDAAASNFALKTYFPHEFNPELSLDYADEEAAPEVPPLSFTVVAVGALDDDLAEGNSFYHYQEFGTPEGVIPADAPAFSRQESYRMITELLQLASGRQRALSFATLYNTNTTEARLIKGLREAGYARPQEIDHMVRGGPKAYKDYVEEWKKTNPDWEKGYTTDAWWEQDIYQKSRRKSAERQAEKDQVEKDERTKEVEAIAKEWVKREYFRQSMAGTLLETTTEETFREQVWERAMFEADLKYRQLKGEIINDAEGELADFKARQERKKQTMLQRAKEELAEILDEDPDKLIPEDFDDKPDDKKNY